MDGCFQWRNEQIIKVLTFRFNMVRLSSDSARSKSSVIQDLIDEPWNTASNFPLHFSTNFSGLITDMKLVKESTFTLNSVRVQNTKLIVIYIYFH